MHRGMGLAGLLLFAVAATGRSTEGGYRPVLPKTNPAKAIMVVDVLDDWRGKDNAEAQDALLAICCLQGLVNRESETKVYLVNFPWRLHWDWYETREKAHPISGVDHPSTVPGWKHPAEAALADGLVPFPATRAELDRGKRYPALSFMLKSYASSVKGKVLCPKSEGTENSGARAAAVNVCTFEGALPLSPELDAYAKAEGHEFSVVADTNGMNQKQSLEWSIERYMGHPKRNRQLLGYCGDIGSNSPIMHDYFIATHTFCYFLYTKTINDADPADRDYDVLTDARYYPPGVVHIGPVEGGHAIQRLQKRGHTVVCGFLANASVTSSIPTEPSTFASSTAEAHEIDPEGLYIAWEIADDGDALDVMSQSMYARLRCDPELGKIPGGIRVNPYLIDLFPAQYRWFAGHANTDVITSMNDGGASNTREGQEAWLKAYRQYLSQSNGSIGIVNFFGTARQWFLDEMAPPFVIAGYQGDAAPGRWTLLKNDARTVHCALEGSKEKDKYAAMLTAVRQAEAKGKPLFYLCRWKESAAVTKTHMDRLRAETSLGRKVYILKPGDLAATAKAWMLSTEKR